MNTMMWNLALLIMKVSKLTKTEQKVAKYFSFLNSKVAKTSFHEDKQRSAAAAVLDGLEQLIVIFELHLNTDQYLIPLIIVS